MRVIAGIARGTRLKTIKSDLTRPTADMVKESVYNIIASRVPMALVLDLFAGSGGLGIEALSRGAQSCMFIDSNPACCRMIRENLEATRLGSGSKVFGTSADSAISGFHTKGMKFDIILLDPPYFKNIVGSTLNNICINDIMNNDGIIVTERHKKDDAPVLPDILELVIERSYGDTVISIYRQKGCQD